MTDRFIEFVNRSEHPGSRTYSNSEIAESHGARYRAVINP